MEKEMIQFAVIYISIKNNNKSNMEKEMIQKYLTFEFPTQPVEKLMILAVSYEKEHKIYVDKEFGCRDEDLMCWVQERLMDDMYDATCDCCGIQLSEDVPIMCYEGAKDILQRLLLG